MIKIKWKRGSLTLAESAKIGYYTQDTGGGDVFHFYMGAEPPEDQLILRGGTRKPLTDPWYLMDMVIDGNPELTGPVKNPPKGVPPYKP
jgi:hypothetical protein